MISENWYEDAILELSDDLWIDIVLIVCVMCKKFFTVKSKDTNEA